MALAIAVLWGCQGERGGPPGSGGPAGKIEPHEDVHPPASPVEDPEVSSLVDGLAGSDAEARQEAARRLVDLAHSEAAVKALGDALEHEDTAVQEIAVQGLIRAGRGAVPELVEDLTRGSPRAREWAALALGEIGPDAGDAAADLANLLADSRKEDRSAALVSALASIGEPAVSELIRILIEGNDEARGWAALALGQIGPGARDAVPMLVDATREPSSRLATRAFQALQRIEAGEE